MTSLKHLTECPTCGGPCEMSWSGLDLVENTGDETLATKHYISKAPDLLQLCEEMKEALHWAKGKGKNGESHDKLIDEKIDSALNKYNELIKDEKDTA